MDPWSSKKGIGSPGLALWVLRVKPEQPGQQSVLYPLRHLPSLGAFFFKRGRLAQFWGRMSKTDHSHQPSDACLVFRPRCRMEDGILTGMDNEQTGRGKKTDGLRRGARGIHGTLGSFLAFLLVGNYRLHEKSIDPFWNQYPQWPFIFLLASPFKNST